MESFRNEARPGGTYKEVNGKEEGFFRRFFNSLVTGCMSCGCLLAIVLAVAVGLSIYFFRDGEKGIKDGISAVSLSSGKEFSEEYVSGPEESDRRIAVIRINGVITRDEDAPLNTSAISGDIVLQLQQALEDETVKAVIMDLDTPGGEVTASDEVYKKILEVRKKKPVVAMMNTLCASGGYYIASACSPIVAGKYTLTGSIGVIISAWNYKGLFDKIGLQSEVYTSGKMKDMLNGARERTPEETALVQELVMNAYDGFVQVVSSSRKIPPEKIKSSIIGDGRVMDGRQALELKLVDQLGYFEDAVKEAEKLASGKDFQVFRYEEKFSFGRFVNFFLSKTSAPAVQLRLPGEGGENVRIRRGVLYFLPYGY
ncbi:MAG: signal peptide peptidase SppA [Lentisphaeria bacterium]|nr:signal peptide peptidase SppA [Lentisphaeria bacterium]